MPYGGVPLLTMMDVPATVQVEAASRHDLAALGRAGAWWGRWGFEPWEWEGIAGVRRRVTFSKGALVGEIARYYADDYIVWTHAGEVDRQRVFTLWRPATDVMLHRFVFVVEDRPRPPRKRSFCLGLRGYLEIHQYRLNGERPRRLRDLAPLIDRSWRIVRGDGEEP